MYNHPYRDGNYGMNFANNNQIYDNPFSNQYYLLSIHDNNNINNLNVTNPNTNNNQFNNANIIPPQNQGIIPLNMNNNPNQFQINTIQNNNYNINTNNIKKNLNPETKIECGKIFGQLNPYQSKQSNGINKNTPILMTRTFNINIIFYDEQLSKLSENNCLCSYFKSKLEGAFYGINHFNLFKYICHKIQQNSRNFILICIGRYAEKIFTYCTQNNINKINIFYIYCKEREKYFYLKDSFHQLKEIFNNFNDLVKEIFYKENKKNYHIRSSNFIFLNDYNSTFIKLHYEIARKYSLYKLFKSKNYDKTKFLELIQDKFAYYANMAKELIYNDDEAMIKFFRDTTQESEESLKKVFNKNHDLKTYISNYTVESFYYRYINKFLRACDFKSFRILSNHICKFIYHLYEYRKNHVQPSNQILYRNMYLSPEEFNNYKNLIGQIICYPSFTSTSLKRNAYAPLQQRQNDVFVELCIQQNNSPSIISIKEFSNHPDEDEYLCLPFTFFRIVNVEERMEGYMLLRIIYLSALNLEKPIEELLLDFIENESDNLDPEGLEMLKLDKTGRALILNPCLKYEVYNNCQFNF